MSESGQPSVRYQRSSGGLLAALVVTVVAVAAFAGFRALTNSPPATPVTTVDYATAVKGARADHELMVLAPPRLPAGWKATSVSYLTGMSPSWHLGMLTDTGHYVGVEEARTTIAELAQQYVDPNATRGKDVQIGGSTWQTWTDTGGDYAVARSLTARGTPVESWLVVGTAPQAQVQALAASLVGGRVPRAK